ncbi:TonB-dependent receptor [candidate division KSB1 bacterium]|nr:TonB-dependent receptor [candidate division KSB1 bacterium]
MCNKFNKEKKISYLALIFLFSVVILFLSSSLSFSQETWGAIEGRITNRQTGERLADVNVTIEGTTLGDVSDRRGHYLIMRIPTGKHTLIVRLIGYKEFKKEIRIRDGKVERVDAKLDATVIGTPEVIVEAKRNRIPELTLRPAEIEISPRAIEVMPGALEDVLRGLQALPGVVATSDFSTQIIVRGGTTDQNLFLFEGIELYNPYRKTGIASLFNPSIVEDIQLYTGAFPAIFGDRLSSVLNVTLRNGSATKKLGAEVGVNLSTANLLFEGKTGIFDGGWIVSGRKSYYDLFSESFVQEIGIVNDVAFPKFEDLQGKIFLQPAKNHRVEFVGLYSQDTKDWLRREELGEQESTPDSPSNKDKTKNALFGGKWIYSQSSKYQLNLFANWYRTNGTADFAEEFVPEEEEKRIDSFFPPPPVFGTGDTISLKYNQDFNFNRYSFGMSNRIEYGNHQVQLGMGVDLLENSFSSELELNDFGRFLFDALESAPNWIGAIANNVVQDNSYDRWHSYLQDRWTQFNGKLLVQPGLRYDHFGLLDNGFLSPRFSISYQLDRKTKATAAWGIFYQSPGFEKMLDIGELVALNRFDSLNGLEPEKSSHYLLSLNHTISDQWRLRVESYFKDFSGLIRQKPEEITVFLPHYLSGSPAYGNSYAIVEETVFSPSTTPVNDAKGKAYGLEFLLEKKTIRASDPWNGWISYSYSDSKREQLLDGKRIEFPFDFNRKHAVNVVMNRRIGNSLQIGLTWRYGSGFPYTPPSKLSPLVGKATNPFDPNEIINFVLTDPETGFARFIPIFESIDNVNSANLPDYHRLDLRISYGAKLKTGSWEIYLDLINVYNRKNVFQYRYITRFEDLFENLPSALHNPKPVLFRQPVYMYPFIPSLGINVSF